MSLLADNHLKRAFVKVAQNPDAVRNWMAIARRLGVAEDELRTIDQSKPSIQEKCFHSLRTWQSNAGDGATLHMLTDRLRKCRYRQLASKYNSFILTIICLFTLIMRQGPTWTEVYTLN